MRIFCSSVWGMPRAASSAARTRDTAHRPPLSACPWCVCGVALGREGQVGMQRFGGSQGQDQVEEDGGEEGGCGDLKKRKRSGGRLKQGWGIWRGFLSRPSSLSLTKQNLPVCISPSGTTSWFTGSGHLLCKWLRTTPVHSLVFGLPGGLRSNAWGAADQSHPGSQPSVLRLKGDLVVKEHSTLRDQMSWVQIPDSCSLHASTGQLLKHSLPQFAHL